MTSELFFFRESEMMKDIRPLWSGRDKKAHALGPKEVEELTTLAVQWITKRWNAYAREGMGRKEALQKACNDSGLSISEEQQKKMLDQDDREKAQDPVVIDYVSEREYHDEIEKADRAGELIAAKKVK